MQGGWAGAGAAGDKGKVQWILLLLAAATVLNAQAGFRTEGRLVLVNAGVYDDRNRFHGELSKEHFRLLDEGVEMQVVSVGIEEVPVSTVILFDVSRSMRQNLEEARQALGRFLDKTRPGDEFCLVAFSDQVPAQCRFTEDPDDVRRQATAMTAAGGTALVDALLTGLRMTKKARNVRRAVLILSDGADNSSAHRWREAQRAALETDAVLYAVGLPGWTGRDALQTLQLRELAENSGGRMVTVRNVRELPAVLEWLEIRQQYVLSFVPPEGAEDKPRHTLRVRLRGEATHHLRVYWRHNYSAMVH